ncbi:MAG TPA: hypothetical protein VF865_18155 [Acidobacteriaceae bacterium]
MSLLLLPPLLWSQEVALSELPLAPVPQQGSAGSGAQGQPASSEEKRTGVMRVWPSFRSESVDVKLPPQTAGQKFKMAAVDSFSPVGLVVRAAASGVHLARNSTPEFGEGAAGYGRYFWHSYVDNAVETLLVEFVAPVTTHEDTRYYRLGRGGVVRRTGYVLKRLVVIRNDAGANTFNVSEVIGSGAAAGLSNLYYPRSERTLSNTMENWGLNVGTDWVSFGAREFWPDITHALFHHSSAQPGASH